MAPMANPKARARLSSLVPQITLSADDLFLSALVRELQAHHGRLPEVGEFDLRFEHPELVSGLLRALQRYPKPARAYLLSVPLTTDGEAEAVEVEMLDAQGFRVKLAARHATPPRRAV